MQNFHYLFTSSQVRIVSQDMMISSCVPNENRTRMLVVYSRPEEPLEGSSRFTALAVLCTDTLLFQGEDAVHDAIRQQQLAVGATGRILAAVKEWGAENEEVLWAVLFSLAVLVRDGANPFQPAIRAVAAAGIPPLLSTALQAYKVPLSYN